MAEVRTADDFKQEDWETLGGQAAQIARERRNENRTSVPYHTGIDPVSAARGRANAAKLRKRNKGRYTR